MTTVEAGNRLLATRPVRAYETVDTLIANTSDHGFIVRSAMGLRAGVGQRGPAAVESALGVIGSNRLQPGFDVADEEEVIAPERAPSQ